MTAKEGVTQLSPDGFSRFYMLVDVLRQVYGGRKRAVRILDVGGGSPFFYQQLKKAGLECELTVLDIIPRPADMHGAYEYIQADATAMDLSDNSYDVVVSTDALEHIPPTGKAAFVRECLRVAKELCIIAAPFATEGVHAAEVTVNEFNKKLFGSGQRWLEEHLEYGKPTIELCADILHEQHIAYDDFGTQPLGTWLLNTHINLIDAKLGLDARAHHKANAFYNEHILEMGECREPTYRHFFVMYVDPKTQKRCDISKYTAAPVDYDKFAQYTNLLFDLLAERIAALTAETAQLSQKLDASNHASAAQQETIQQQAETIQQQAATLQELEPLRRLLRRQPVKTLHRVVRKFSK